MKKFLALAATLLLFGCFGSGPAEHEDVVSEANEVAAVPLTEDSFVELSARILCLPSNNPTATADEVEELARDQLTEMGVTEESFSDFQEGIELDSAEKTRISHAIVGRMADFCSVGGVVEEEEAADEGEAVAAEAEDEIVNEGEELETAEAADSVEAENPEIPVFSPE